MLPAESTVSGAKPTGLEIRRFEPGNRASFARRLERQLGTQFRAVPLEEPLEPLLKQSGLSITGL
ncbi:MAG TPA: hypothetical protein VGC79_01915 [Polyangiaceae bacterium]